MLGCGGVLGRGGGGCVDFALEADLQAGMGGELKGGTMFRGSGWS